MSLRSVPWVHVQLSAFVLYGLCHCVQAAAGSSGNVSVYDIYSLSTEAGEAGGESLAALGAPLVQVMGVLLVVR